MGKVVVSEFVTLDGVMEDPGGAEKSAHGGWAFRVDRGQEGNRFKYEELMAADAQLLGRVTYEGFATAWPSMKGDPFGEKMNAMPKYVVSSAPLAVEWTNASRLDGELAGAVRELAARYQGDILIAGSATLVQALAALGLIDEYRLMVHPLVLGSGRRLFAEGVTPRSLRITESQRAGDCMVLTLAPVAEA